MPSLPSLFRLSCLSAPRGVDWGYATVHCFCERFTSLAHLGTTQCKHWIFTAEQLVSKRKESNQKAAESVLRIAPSPGKRPKIEEGAAAGQSVGGIVDCVTPEEELTLQEYYLNGILKTKARGTLSLPPNVEATSVLFFKRFFLSNSIMDCHPKEVMITAMWLACKVATTPQAVTLCRWCFSLGAAFPA